MHYGTSPGRGCFSRGYGPKRSPLVRGHPRPLATRGDR
jgi:hypothetical protein